MDSLFEIMEETNQIYTRSNMESGLLNAFHDDHFDGNYSKFDNNLDLWSGGNNAMGLQLTETLHGILPIPETEEDQHYFETESEHRIPCRFHSETELQETIYNMDNEGDDYIVTNYSPLGEMSESMSSSIEIISVDPNCEFNSPVTIDDISDTESILSSIRNSHYNSNSDSSSIGEYESHTSEDDDEDDEVEKSHNKLDNSLTKNIQSRILKQEHNKQFYTASKHPHIPKNGLSNNVSFSIDDIDKLNVHLDDRKSFSIIENLGCFDSKPLDIDINVKNFDLTEFITSDDFDLIETTSTETHVNQAHSISIKDIKIEDVNKSRADSDTEAIIDIETVHDNDDKSMLLRKPAIEYNDAGDLNESFTQVEDDTKRDPSWSPTTIKSTKLYKSKAANRQGRTKKSSNLITQCNRMLSNKTNTATSNSSNKSYVVMNRKKFGLGRGKNISMCTKPDLNDSVCDANSFNETEIKCKINETKKHGAINSNNINSKVKSSINSNNKIITNNIGTITAITIPKIEVKIEKNERVKDEHEDTKFDLPKSCSGLVEEQSRDAVNSDVSAVLPSKRKLNLEEYKRRRENQLIGDTKIKKFNPIPVSTIKEEDTKRSDKSNQIVNTLIHNGSTKVSPKHPINTLKSHEEFYDPILEAKNKVLRMQELKKVARSRLIDSTVSSKVGPITPILPLEQICNGNLKSQEKTVSKINPEYEEIIIVSVSCNTDITLPPVFEKLHQTTGTNSNGEITKSSSLLSNINDTIKKANAAKISSNSLLSSIQDVVLKNSTTTLLNCSQLSQKCPNIGVSPPSQISPQKPPISQIDQCNLAHINVPENSSLESKEIEHGEDKIIMHLRKDRIRKRTFSISIQTADLPQFPPLTLLLAEKFSNSQWSKTKKRKRHERRYRSRRSKSESSDDEEYRSRSHVRYRSISSQGTNRSVSPRSSRCYSNSRRNGSPYRKISRRSSRSSSQTKTRDSFSTDSDTDRRTRSSERRNRHYSTSRSSSSSSSSSQSRSRSRSPQSKSRSRSRSRFSGNRSHLSNHRHSSPAVEERRIVYVGRIERETSKEDLKRKFSLYGPIKQITLHYKDTGMKYGFVTFERAQDAYDAIDRGMADSKINMYDVSFGGRRAFCRASYSDLDGAATNSLQVLPYSNTSRNIPSQDDSFEALLQKVKDKMSSTKSTTVPRVKT